MCLIISTITLIGVMYVTIYLKIPIMKLKSTPICVTLPLLLIISYYFIRSWKEEPFFYPPDLIIYSFLLMYVLGVILQLVPGPYISIESKNEYCNNTIKYFPVY